MIQQSAMSIAKINQETEKKSIICIAYKSSDEEA